MRAPILFVNAPERARRLVERWRGARPEFSCVLGHTDTCLIAGISSAGVSEDLRAYTPAADAEVVHLGEARCLPMLPSHPLGAPGPAGITRAALALAGLQARFIAVGLRVWPATDYFRLDAEPGVNIASGNAVPRALALFEAGVALGRETAARTSLLVLGESVPGGTTTALALLLALGYAAEGRVSGSMPGNAHALKTRVARAALEAAGLLGSSDVHPLDAVSRVGDPMQPVVAGMTVGATGAGCDVLLAGGSQMIAVAALVRAVAGVDALDRVAIGTTRWIVQDPEADVPGLASEVSADLPLLAINLDFADSRHEGLCAYERFLVKEGVGAGGACIAALLASGASLEDLHRTIDLTYDALLGRLTVH
jgi:uncharacterized protein (TIGR00303 family)